MSIAFNGTSQYLANGSAPTLDHATRTIVFWKFGAATPVYATVFCNGATASYQNFGVYHANGNYGGNPSLWEHGFSGGVGEWSWPRTDSAWIGTAISYDNGSTSNDPFVRENGAAATVTERSTPVGTATAASAGVKIAVQNSGDAATFFSDRAAHVQYFNAILSAKEMDSAVKFPGTVRRGLLHYWPMLRTGDLTDWIGGTVLTATGTPTQGANNPPCALWTPKRYFNIPYVSAAAGGTILPMVMQHEAA